MGMFRLCHLFFPPIPSSDQTANPNTFIYLRHVGPAQDEWWYSDQRRGRQRERERQTDRERGSIRVSTELLREHINKITPVFDLVRFVHFGCLSSCDQMKVICRLFIDRVLVSFCLFKLSVNHDLFHHLFRCSLHLHVKKHLNLGIAPYESCL